LKQDAPLQDATKKARCQKKVVRKRSGSKSRRGQKTTRGAAKNACKKGRLGFVFGGVYSE